MLLQSKTPIILLYNQCRRAKRSPLSIYLALTEGEEKERPPILPPDLAASASPGAAKATAATVAATANFFAMSVVKVSHGLLLPSPSPAAAMRSGAEVAADFCCARASPAVAPPVPTRRAEGAGTKAEAGTHASRANAAVDLMLAVVCLSWEKEGKCVLAVRARLANHNVRGEE